MNQGKRPSVSALYEGLEFQINLFPYPKLDPVNDLHLLEEGGLAGLAGSEQQDLDHLLEAPPLHLQVPVDPATLDPPLNLLGTFLERRLNEVVNRSPLSRNGYRMESMDIWILDNSPVERRRDSTRRETF